MPFELEYSDEKKIVEVTKDIAGIIDKIIALRKLLRLARRYAKQENLDSVKKYDAERLVHKYEVELINIQKKDLGIVSPK